MRSSASRGAGLVAVVALLALSACAPRLSLDDAQLGFSDGFDESAPGFVFEAAPVVDADRLMLELRASIPARDLVFSVRGSEYVAVAEITFAVRDPRGHTLASRDIVDTLVVRSHGATQADARYGFSATFPMPAGHYVAEAGLGGTGSARLATRRVEVAMPDAADAPLITPLRLEKSDSPILGAHLPRWRLNDAPVVTADVFGTGQDASTVFTMWRVRSDTAVAAPAFWMGAPRGSLRFRGAAFDEPLDTLLAATLPVPRLELPLLQEGVYVIEARLPNATARSVARPIIVLPPDFPRLVNVDDLIEALAYIAYPSEIASMREGLSADQRRRSFDAFWGSLFSDRRVAEDVMRRYFERIEMANRLFTVHQPGWRTDRGMVYVLFGPPDGIDRTPEGETWHYGYGRTAGAPAFTFESVRFPGAPWPMGHHVLQRAPRFEEAWLGAVRRWRTGRVL